jgi:hypothetical protein
MMYQTELPLLPTNADDILAGHADAHHLRAEDGPENSLRSNKDFGLDCTSHGKSRLVL